MFVIMIMFSYSFPLSIQDTDFITGFEISELYQNNFKNLGLTNFTAIFGIGTHLPNNKLRRFRIAAINVDLSTEHLSQNPFIHGNTEGLTGRLTVFRIYSIHSTRPWRNGFLDIYGVTGLGPGYVSTNLSKSGENLSEKGLSLATTLFIRWVMWKRIFIEFPVVDFSIFLWKNGSMNGQIDNVNVTTPPMFQVYLWTNAGIIW